MATESIADIRDKSHATWEEMSAGWQKHNDYLWETGRHVGEWIVERIDPQPGQTVLDVACGPGDTGFLAARSLGDEGRLISADFSEGMVKVAQARAASLGVTNAEFRTMDAENMEIEDASVDAVICRWGFMLMPDPARALSECRRVLKPGGRFGFSVWGTPEKNPWVTCFGMVMMQQGYPPQGDPWGPGGMFSMAEPEKVRQMVIDAGFPEPEIEEQPVHWRFKDFADVWTFSTEVAGAIAALVKTLDAEQVDDLRQAVIPAVEPYRSRDGYDFPGMTVNAATSKP